MNALNYGVLQLYIILLNIKQKKFKNTFVVTQILTHVFDKNFEKSKNS
jgi:hypothetical protein